MKADWVLIANATRARLLLHERDGGVVILESFIHPAGRGRVEAPSDPGFAQELGRYLEQEARMDHFSTLSLIVPEPFLAQLRAELGKFTRTLVCGAREQDVTAVAPGELGRVIARELAAEAA
jgi:hypothetical protein